MGDKSVEATPLKEETVLASLMRATLQKLSIGSRGHEAKRSKVDAGSRVKLVEQVEQQRIKTTGIKTRKVEEEARLLPTSILYDFHVSI